MAFCPITVHARRYAPPRDRLRLETDEPRVFDLANALWEEKKSAEEGEEGTIGDSLESELSFAIWDRPAPDGVDSFDLESLERNLRWTHTDTEYRCEIPGALSVLIDLARVHVEGSAPLHLLRNPSSSFSPSPSLTPLFSRYLLEAPAAVLLGRRAWQVLHAGAVVGPRGAVVVRGGAGAGKSTLVAAAFRDGLGVLADESLLVAREDPDDLVAAVRDLTLLPDSARLLGIEEETSRAFSGGESKRRVDLSGSSRPAQRRARRVATLLLGPRSPGPARLARLDPGAFLEEFRRGEIPQERIAGDPDAVARAWGSGFRLDGAEDLCGAAQILRSLVK